MENAFAAGLDAEQRLLTNKFKLEGKKVLVVDDNLTNRAVWKNQLEQWNLVPVLANGGDEALEILSQDSNFDLVLTDMQMPFMDGIMLTETIRQKYAALPVILLSSIGDEFGKTMQDIFSAVLTKPIKQHVLGKYILSTLHPQDQQRSEVNTVQQILPADMSQISIGNSDRRR